VNRWPSLAGSRPSTRRYQLKWLVSWVFPASWAGRPKTDRADSIWLAKIVERGMISSSFVPPEPIRRLRTHTRYRRHLTQARTAEKQRVEKLLEDGHLKLSSVISDIYGVSGRDMLDAIAAGQRDPKALAQLARGTTMLTSVNALMSDPSARYQDLGADYYEHRMHARRQARNHVKSLERLGYRVTIQALSPDASMPVTVAS
jgi:hypothetical protein